jgi:hypothetical protein
MRLLPSTILVVVLGITSTTRAADDVPEGDGLVDAPKRDEQIEPSPARAFDPPGIDYPAPQAFGTGTSLYVDETWETTSDLSTFTWVTGHGNNFRTSLGGTLTIGELRLAAEIPLQYTRLHIDTLQGLPTADQDRDKASWSLGDVITGAGYLWSIPSDTIRLQMGPSLRARLPTHTTEFTFTLANGTPLTFGFPYYLHLAAGLVFLASSGFLTLRIDQGVLAMLAKDANIDGVRQPIPNLYFWESHYSVIAQNTGGWGGSAELVSCIQLNRIDDGGYTTLHNVKALMFEVAATVEFGTYRASMVGRFGLTHGAQDFGVITFSGTKAVMGRLAHVF